MFSMNKERLGLLFVMLQNKKKMIIYLYVPRVFSIKCSNTQVSKR